ncbi:MAG: alkyldihydroxyacetonephosphate synthase, partial [Solirubrobacterales bacterium]|nr:alkyldihydroxyacetonephosphate synthase [Solirubrobacterales bacterium]
AVREIAQSGLHPANCRLLDASEAELTGAGGGEANLLILGFESAHHPVDAALDVALEIAKAHGGTPNSPPTGRKPTHIGGNRPIGP